MGTLIVNCKKTTCERMENDGHEEGIEGVDPECGLRRVGVRVGMNYQN